MFAQHDGLIVKHFLCSAWGDKDIGGGLYFFETKEQAEAYLASEFWEKVLGRHRVGQGQHHVRVVQRERVRDGGLSRKRRRTSRPTDFTADYRVKVFIPCDTVDNITRLRPPASGVPRFGLDINSNPILLSKPRSILKAAVCQLAFCQSNHRSSSLGGLLCARRRVLGEQKSGHLLDTRGARVLRDATERGCRPRDPRRDRFGVSRAAAATFLALVVASACARPSFARGARLDDESWYHAADVEEFALDGPDAVQAHVASALRENRERPDYDAAVNPILPGGRVRDVAVAVAAARGDIRRPVSSAGLLGIGAGGGDGDDDGDDDDDDGARAPSLARPDDADDEASDDGRRRIRGVLRRRGVGKAGRPRGHDRRRRRRRRGHPGRHPLKAPRKAPPNQRQGRSLARRNEDAFDERARRRASRSRVEMRLGHRVRRRGRGGRAARRPARVGRRGGRRDRLRGHRGAVDDRHGGWRATRTGANGDRNEAFFADGGRMEGRMEGYRDESKSNSAVSSPAPRRTIGKSRSRRGTRSFCGGSRARAASSASG